MSYQTPTIQFIPQGLRARIDLYFVEKGQGFNPTSFVQQRLASILMMEAMTDAELAALDLTRDEILDFVFEDCFHDAAPIGRA